MGATPGWLPAPGTIIDDRYRLDAEVGRGSMGMIMRGEQIRMHREVAVKLLSPEVASLDGYRARFRREVDLASTLEHPNIVRCYDFGETADGVLYLVMELLEGQTLKELSIIEQRLSTRRGAALMTQLLDGLATAHLRDIVHRDLKPGNVFVTRDHRGVEIAKILDFGLAKSLSSDHVTLTHTGAICGTASYVAPEAIALQQVGPEGDVYSVGLIALELLLARQVCTSRAMAQTFLQHLVVPARIPRRVWDTDLGQIIARSLHKHPAERYASAESMYQELAAIVDDVPDFTLEPSELPPLPRDDLDDNLLRQLGNGRYAEIDALSELPRPEPWSLDEPEPDDAQTQRGLVLDLERILEADTVVDMPKPVIPPPADPDPDPEPEPEPEPVALPEAHELEPSPAAPQSSMLYIALALAALMLLILVLL